MVRRANSMLAIAIVSGLWVLCGAAWADELYVPSQYRTVQDAIDAAVEGDVVIVADGTYTGEGNRDIDFHGKAIVVKSENGLENCIIDCNGTEDEPHRGFYFHSGEYTNSVLDGFTITGGYATAIPSWPIPLSDSAMIPNGPLGGAIYCNNASPTITNCNIIGNKVSAMQGGSLGWFKYSAGGGIYCQGSKGPTISNCIITGNQTFVPVVPITPTGNPLDMAIEGQGYFVLNDGTREVFTRRGQFAVNAASMLVDPKTGYYVQRIGLAGEDDGFQTPGDSNIYMQYDIALPPKATSTIVVAGNLSADETLPVSQTQVLQSNIRYTVNGYTALVHTKITDLDQFSGTASGGKIYVAGIKPDGTEVTDSTGLIVSETTTLGDLLTYIDNKFGAGNVTASLVSGKICITDGSPGYSRTDIMLSYAPGGSETLITPAYFKVTTVGGDEVQNVNITIYDSIGARHALSAAFVRTDTPNTWDMVLTSIGDKGISLFEPLPNLPTLAIVPNPIKLRPPLLSEIDPNLIKPWPLLPIDPNRIIIQPIPVPPIYPVPRLMPVSSVPDNIHEITFDGRRIEGIEFNGNDGTYAGLNSAIGDTAQFTITFPHDTSNPQTINIDMGTPGQLDGLTEFAGSSTAVARQQDGYEPGRLYSVSVDSQGTIIGLFSNDIERDIARIQLALFNDPNALDPIDHHYFIPTPASGSPIATDPGDNGAGTILGKHLENIDDGGYVSQQSIVYTGRRLDAAIDGDGYFVLNDGTRNLFTRIGSFDSDVNSMLIDPATGYRVQRIGSVGETEGFQIPGDSNIYISYNAQVPANPTSEIVISGNLSADDSYGEKNISISIYDSQGGRHILSATFVRTEIPNTWDLVITSVTGEIEPPADRRIGGITFNGSDGSYSGLNGGVPSFDVTFPFDLGAIQTIAFSFGTVGWFDGLTQFAGHSTAVARQQDGYVSGQLCSVSVDRDGSIVGIFSNGIKKELATIQLALFQNPEYLEDLDNGYFVPTTASGQPVAAQPGENGAGTIIPWCLEDPNADRYFYQWYIVNTGRPLDMAIEAKRYYFVLNDGSQDVFTRIGSFDIDADGMLAEPAGGLKVQRIGSVGEENGYQIPGDSNIYISYDMLIAPRPTSEIVVRGNLSADDSYGEKDISISIYDSQGGHHILYGTFVRTEIPDTWDLVITSVTGEIDVPVDRRIEGITFSSQNGSYAGLSGSQVNPSFDVKFPFDLGAVQTISFSFGTVGWFDGLTQFATGTSGSSTAVAREADGYAAGILSSVSVNNEGTLVGSFSNGIKSNIAQIKIAAFQAPWALETIDHGYFVSTTASGQAIATQALSGCAGPIHGGALFKPVIEVPRAGHSFGGGIYCTAPAIIKNCLITDNSSDNGGGIYCQTDTTLENCTISGNLAVNTGGGIYCSIITGPMEPFNLPLPLPNPENTVITNSILSDNIAQRGPQLALESIGIWLTPTGIGEPDSQFEPNFPGLRVTYSNIQGGEQGVHIEYDDYLIWDQGNIDADPYFFEPGYWDDVNSTPDDPNDDSWVEGDYYLLPDSPCINAGDPNYEQQPSETDIEGNQRVIGGRIDMGAYEYWPPVKAELWIFPQVINRYSRQKRILAWLRLPEGVDKDQIDGDEPILLYPGEIEAVRQYVISHGRAGRKRTSVLAFFNKAELMDAVADNGPVELEAVGNLKTGRYFYGTDMVRIKARRKRVRF